ncbi:hypothetical protein ACFLZ4_02225 [Patescibacteria group bacterium]
MEELYSSLIIGVLLSSFAVIIGAGVRGEGIDIADKMSEKNYAGVLNISFNLIKRWVTITIGGYAVL